MSKNKNSDKICFVLFGETGHGKSTLGNALLGKEFFKTNDTVQSVTKEIYGCQGVDKSSDLFVIDTPGINDTEGNRLNVCFYNITDLFSCFRYLSHTIPLNVI